jgi:hypothetical protein
LLGRFRSLVRHAIRAVWAWSLRPVRAARALKGLALFAVLFGAILLFGPQAARAWGLDWWPDEREPAPGEMAALSLFFATWAGVAYALARITEVEERLRLYEELFRRHFPPGQNGQPGA